MKKIFKYIIAIILTYFLVNILTNFITRPYYRDLSNYEILTQSPVVEIAECRTSYIKGYVKGTVTNNTGKIINNAYIRIELYKADGEFLGIEYYEIPYFNNQEEVNFEVEFNYKDVGNVKISVEERNS